MLAQLPVPFTKKACGHIRQCDVTHAWAEGNHCQLLH